MLFLSSTLPRFPGDTQAPFVLEQARAWKEAVPSDIVTILAPHDPLAKASEEQCQVHIRRFRYFWPLTCQKLAYPAILPNIREKPWLIMQLPFFLFAEFFSARRLALDIKANIVYAHWMLPQGLIAFFLAKVLGIPYFLHNHSSDLHAFGLWRAPGKWLARKIICQSAGLFCTNEQQRQYALELFQNDRPVNMAEKIIVKPMGVSLPEDIQKIANCSKNHRFLFGSISRLTRKKGLEHVIEAASILDKDPGIVTLAIAGEGEERDRLVSAASGMDVEFAGFVDGQDKWAFFADCRFMIFASKSSAGDVEGMPVDCSRRCH